MKTSTTLRLPLIAKIAIAMTFINTWVIFEETVVDLLLFVSVAPLRRHSGPTPSTTPSLPLFVKIAIAMTFLNTLVILFGWPGVLLRVCL